jgi:glycopeptide antibiotics resistance protein
MVVAAIYLGMIVLLAFVPWRLGAECPWYLNVLFFLPVGVLFTVLFTPHRWLIAVAFGVLGAAWIEAAQAIWMPEGYGRVEDTFWGAIGVLAGIASVVIAVRFMRSHGSFRIVTEAGHREIPQD